MIEKIGHIKNPLTVIALFAGTAEVFGTVVLPFVDPESQPEFISFLTTFPFFIAFLFFVTLWINHRVLYAPSDYKNEDNFIGQNFVRAKPKLDQNLGENGVVTSETVPKAPQILPEELEAQAIPPQHVEALQPREEPALEQALPVQHEEDFAKYRKSGLWKQDVASLLQRQLHASYDLFVTPKAMPNLIFDIVLNSKNLNCVGKIVYVTKANMEKVVNQINGWYFAVDAFRCSLSDAEQAKFQCVVCIVHSDLSVSEIIRLERTLESLSLQVPFSISVQEYSAEELIERTRGKLAI